MAIVVPIEEPIGTRVISAGSPKGTFGFSMETTKHPHAANPRALSEFPNRDGGFPMEPHGG
jgi:hypothetical protein